jgi:hypothetical protein
VGQASNPGPWDELPNEFVDAIEEDEPSYDDIPPEIANSDSEVSDDSHVGSLNDDPEADTADEAEGSATEINDDAVVPPWDAKLSPEQIGTWQIAEEALKIKRSVAPWVRTKRKASTKAAELTSDAARPLTIPDGSEFVQSNVYKGHYPGYFYGTRDNATGYWLDTAKSIPISLAELLKRSQELQTAKSAVTRRRRDLEGTRIRLKSRRWHAIRCNRGEANQMLLSDVNSTLIGVRPLGNAGL